MFANPILLELIMCVASREQVLRFRACFSSRAAWLAGMVIAIVGSGTCVGVRWCALVCVGRV